MKSRPPGNYILRELRAFQHTQEEQRCTHSTRNIILTKETSVLMCHREHNRKIKAIRHSPYLYYLGIILHLHRHTGVAKVWWCSPGSLWFLLYRLLVFSISYWCLYQFNQHNSFALCSYLFRLLFYSLSSLWICSLWMLLLEFSFLHFPVKWKL